MAIALIGRQVYSAPLAASQTINFALTGGDPGVANSTPNLVNDFVLVEMAVTYQGTSTTLTLAATNYLARWGETARNDSACGNYRGQYRYMPATPDTNIVITAGTVPTGAVLTVLISAFRGVATTTPFDGVTLATAGGVNGGVPNPAAVTSSATAASAKSLLIVEALSSFNVDTDYPHSFGSFTAPSGETFDDFLSYSSGGKSVTGDAWATVSQGIVRDLLASTSYDPPAGTWGRGTNASDTWQAATFCLRWDGTYVAPLPTTSGVGTVSIVPSVSAQALAKVSASGSASLAPRVAGTAAVGSPAALTAIGAVALGLAVQSEAVMGFIPSPSTVITPLPPEIRGRDLRIAINALIAATGAAAVPISSGPGRVPYRTHRAAINAVITALGPLAAPVPRLPRITASDADIVATVDSLINIVAAQGPAEIVQIVAGPTSVSTPEDPNTDIFIGTYQANVSVTWELAGADVDAFTLDPDTGDLDFAVPTDYETKSSYSVAVIATSATGQQASRQVTVTITNVLDAPALLTPDLSATSVQENRTQNFQIARVTTQAGVTWTLSNTAGNRFAKSGNFIVAGATNIDYETTPVVGSGRGWGIQITQTLADSPNSPLVTDHTIFVLDIASEGGADTTAPVINAGPTTVTISENVAAGTLIGTFGATEPVTWSKSGTDATSFTLDASTGDLSLIPSPDFETKASYTLTVTATDTATNSTNRTVTVNISDVDEVQPTITSPTTISTPEGQLFVQTLTADEPVTWSIPSTAGGDSALFTIEPATGRLEFRQVPSFRNPRDIGSNNSYSVTVRATDQSPLANFRAVTLTVNVTEVVAGAARDRIGAQEGWAIDIEGNDAFVRSFTDASNTYSGPVSGLMTTSGTVRSVALIKLPWRETGSGVIEAISGDALPGAVAQVLQEASRPEQVGGVYQYRDAFEWRSDGHLWRVIVNEGRHQLGTNGIDLGVLPASTRFSVAHTYRFNYCANAIFYEGNPTNGQARIDLACIYPVMRRNGTLRLGGGVAAGSTWLGQVLRSY